jgi:hypothetical protein
VEEAKISELLAEASRVVDAANLPDDLRATAFAKAVDLLTGAGGDAAARHQAKPQGSGAGGAEPAATTGSLDAAALTLKIDRATLDTVVGIENGQPVVHVPPSALATKPAPAMRQLILVLTAVRQGGGWEDVTNGDVLKKQLSTHHKGHYDSNNFWNAVGRANDSIRNTGGKLKMIPAGYTAAGTLITALAGGGEKKSK